MNPNLNVSKKDEIMKTIELNTEKNLTMLQKNNDVNLNTLQNIMLQGADEFKNKTGRHMTYAEMRSMYG